MPTIFQTLDRNGKPHRNWRFKYIDWTGKRRTATGLPSKSDTKALAWKIQAEQDEIRKGLRPAPKESDKPRSFEEVAAEYLAWGHSQGGHGGRPWSAKHESVRRAHLKFWQITLRLERLQDVNGSLARAETILRELQQTGSSGKTLNNYAESISALCDWAMKRGYLDHDPLKNLVKFDKTPRTIRRAATVDEIKRILAVAKPERRLLYEVALATGLRSNELQSLCIRHLDCINNGFKLEAGFTKNRKACFQSLHPALVCALAQTAAGKQPNDPLLVVPRHTAAALYCDMAKAGVPKLTAEGKLDFHALRVAYITFVFEAGASAKEAQVSARHSSPDLTMNVYARTRSERLSEIAQSVGDAFLVCPTDVQQPAAQGKRDQTIPLAAAACEMKDDGKGGGSNPANAASTTLAEDGQRDNNPGLDHTQVGQQANVGADGNVVRRTEITLTMLHRGRLVCPTVVKRDLALLLAKSAMLSLDYRSGRSA